MKLLFKLGIFIAFLLSSILGIAQSKSDYIYDMFSGKDGVVSLSFSKSVLKPFEIFIDDDTQKVIYKMKKIRFMAYNQKKGDLKTTSVYQRIQKELKGGSYFKIDPAEIDCSDCDIHADDDELTLIGHGNRKEMDEFHIIIFDDDTCLLFSFFGDITIDDLKECGKFSSSTKGIVAM